MLPSLRSLSPGMTGWDQTRGWLQARLLLRIPQSPRQRGHGHSLPCHLAAARPGISWCCPGPRFPVRALGQGRLFSSPTGLGVDVLCVCSNPGKSELSCGSDLLSGNIWRMGDFLLCGDRLGQDLGPKWKRGLEI